MGHLIIGTEASGKELGCLVYSIFFNPYQKRHRTPGMVVRAAPQWSAVVVSALQLSPMWLGCVPGSQVPRFTPWFSQDFSMLCMILFTKRPFCANHPEQFGILQVKTGILREWKARFPSHLSQEFWRPVYFVISGHLPGSDQIPEICTSLSSLLCEESACGR